jgi:hypothetical protein
MKAVKAKVIRDAMSPMKSSFIYKINDMTDITVQELKSKLESKEI